jgi:asparagine synthase (glutamine-hydrolysing)
MILGTSRCVDLATPTGRFSVVFPDGSLSTRANAPEIFLGRWGVASLDAEDRAAEDKVSGSWLAFSGNPIFLGVDRTESGSGLARAARLLRILESAGLDALKAVDGCFAIAWWSARQRRLTLIRDRFGIEPFYYTQRSGPLLFGSRIRDLTLLDQRAFALSTQGLVEYLTYCFVPGNATLDQDVYRVPPGGAVLFNVDANELRSERWYRLSYRDPIGADEQQIAEQYRELLDQAVYRRLSSVPAGAFLSGGMDSSSVVTFMRRHLQGEIRTFGFRCAGTSFDESYYARALASELGTVHREVDYGEADSLSVVSAIAEMEVPFCDIGIEVGTWLLAKAAGESVGYLLTGDGGDELWASHPVYAAQRLVAYYDCLPLPNAVKKLVQRLTDLVRDSDQKRNLGVIVKRLLPPVDLPVALGPFRWRTYYTPAQLDELLQPEWAQATANANPFAPVLAAYEGYEGPDDGISAHLYNDYITASSFYFSRLQLVRHFGVEARVPFYDRELVEYGARIPARLKLEGIERTKRLFRQAMEGVLPNVINHRKDKLGHSVPLKNWLRGSGLLGTHVRTALKDTASPLATLLRREPLDRWIDEHDSRRHNRSHRLWAAYVLGEWLKVRAGSRTDRFPR